MSRPAKVWQLTTAERELVAANVGLAWYAARRRWRPQYVLSEDEVLSAAFLGLCHAAHCPTRDRELTFTTYAMTAINHRISHEAKRRFEKIQKLPLQSLGVDVAVLESYREAEIEYANEEVGEWMVTLSEEDRGVVRDHMNGDSYAKIGKRLGLTRSAVSARHRRLVANAGGKR